MVDGLLTGALGCVGCCAFFTVSLYVWPATRRSDYNRDEGGNIRRRLLSFLVCDAVGYVLLRWHLRQRGCHADPLAVFCLGQVPGALARGGGEGAAAGLGPLRTTATALYRTSLLFAGVIATRAIAAYNEDGPRFLLKGVREALCAAFGRRSVGSDEWWEGVRNYVVCPLSEEWYFRAVPFELLTPLAPNAVRRPRWVDAAVTAGVFSLAHVHHAHRHFHDFWRQDVARHGPCPVPVPTRTAGSEGAVEAPSLVGSVTPDEWDRHRRRRVWRKTAGSVCGSVLVTSTFGLLSAFLFMSLGGQVLATSATHAFCNFVGPPTLDWVDGTEGGFTKRQRAVIGISYAIGVAGFVMSCRAS